MRQRLGASVKDWLPAGFLALAVLLGGASGVDAGAIANGILQILSILLILYCLWERRSSGVPSEARPPLWIGLLFFLVVAATLVPLPETVWQQLPGREGVSGGLALIGMEKASLSLSLAPQATISSLPWLLPPLAAYLLALGSSHKGRKLLAGGVVVLAIISTGLGIAQLLGGATALRPYEITNPGLPVGFFANANHFGTLLVCAIPFCGYIAARAVRQRTGPKRGSGVALAVTAGLFLVTGILSIGSLAAVGLLLVGATATFLIYRRAARGELGWAWIGGVAALFLLFLGMALMGPLQEQALTGKLSDDRTSRKVMAATTIVGINDTFPAGTGLGSFPQAYRTYEDQAAIGDEWINHTHNDYLEFVMELGVAGALLILLFLLWWSWRSIGIWRSNVEGADLGRAGSIVVLVILLHSIVDYPIRTSAIAALFAMACALMIPVSSRHRSTGSRRESPETDAPDLRHLEAD
jgi:O-antigen ligase